MAVLSKVVPSNLLGYILVPCPFFLPLEPLVDTGWAIQPRAPLGRLFAGVCHACEPPVPAEHPRCNFGYARGECPRFPSGAPFDAVRFARLDSGETFYVFEKDHAPAKHGRIGEPDELPVLSAQARAFRG
jgi:hypothetical protein